MRLSPAQIAEFRRDGFLRLEGAVGPEEIAALRARVTSILSSSAGHADFSRDIKYGSIIGEGMNTGNNVCRIEYMLEKGPEFLRLLGHPTVLSVAADLHDDQIVLTWEDMVVKTPGAGFHVALHQDLLHQSLPGPVFSIGIYLDSSEHDPLRIVPGSQELGPLSPAELRRAAETNADRFVEVRAKSGDLVVHNVLAIHESAPNDSGTVRRVMYFEFRTVMQVLYQSPWDAEWLRRRLHYIPSAIQFRRLFPGMDGAHEWEDLLHDRRSWLPGVPALPIDDLDLRVHHDPAIRLGA